MYNNTFDVFTHVRKKKKNGKRKGFDTISQIHHYVKVIHTYQRNDLETQLQHHEHILVVL